MFSIRLSDSALEDLRYFKKGEQVLLLDTIERHLAHDPLIETRNRKRLRPNDLANWELRIDRFRAFYDVDEESREIMIKAVGEKDHNILRIRGREYTL